MILRSGLKPDCRRAIYPTPRRSAAVRGDGAKYQRYVIEIIDAKKLYGDTFYACLNALFSTAHPSRDADSQYLLAKYPARATL